MVTKFRKVLLLASLAAFLLAVFPPSPVLSQSPDYEITATVDKTQIDGGENFTITLTAKNTSSQTINNFEIRVPFVRTVTDADYELEDPSFNKILESIEFPAGFNNRSWLITSFNSGDTKTFKITYKVVSSPTKGNGLLSEFTLPITWVDPAGLESNKLISSGNFRIDVYINKAYKNSINVPLPKLDPQKVALTLVKLNPKYLYPGTKTTDLSKLNVSDLKSVANFTLDSEDVSIEWQKPIDLSSENAGTLLSSLDQYIETSWGKVSYKGQIPFLSDIPVKITFKKAYFTIKPKIKIGENIEDLKEPKGSYSPGTKSVIINLDKLAGVSLISDIITEKAVYETDQERNEMLVKVSDPKAKIKYKLSNREFIVSNVDLEKGSFVIPVTIANGSVEVEVSVELGNGEISKKVFLVKHVTQPTPIVTSTPAPETISLLFNQLSIILILTATGIIAIIMGVIYFLFSRKNKQNVNSIEFNSITVSRLGDNIIDDPHLFPTQVSNSQNKDYQNHIDLVSLKSTNSVQRSRSSSI